MARTALTLFKAGSVELDDAATVELWTPDEGGAPWFQAPKIGDFTNNLDGTYHIDLVNSVVGTVVVNGVAMTGWRNRQFIGDTVGVTDGSITAAKLADNAVTTAKIADDAVTPAKTSFAKDY